jgi:bacterioferritin
MLVHDSPGAALAATLQRQGNNFHSPIILRPTPHSDQQVNMTTPDSSVASVTRESLIAGLNEDLAREYQAIIAYVVYSQAIKGAQYMTIAKELEVHAAEELSHALIIANQIDYLGGEITATPKPVKTSDDPKAMLRFDLENERETILAYRERVRQCEALGEYAISEHIREILLDEQEHLVDLATALGEDPPNLSQPQKSGK